jgi:outer membrane protein TolC
MPVPMGVIKWTAVAVAACIGVVGIAGSVSAQAPALQLAAVQQTARTGPVRTLTLDEAVQLALAQNLTLQVERVNLSLQDETVSMARAAFVPTLTSDFGYDEATTPPDSFLSGNQGTLRSAFAQGAAGMQQWLPWAGARYALGWDASRSTSNSIFTNFDPRLRSNFRLSVAQPLLRDFATDSRRTQLVVSKRNREISDVDFRAVVVRTVRDVKNAYWDLKAAIANLEVQRQSLELARRTLRDNRLRVQVGTMAPLDIVEAEAEVARNEETVITAESTIWLAEDRLRVLVFDSAAPDFWTMVLEPVDAPQMDGGDVDIEAAMRHALDTRTDLRIAQKSLDNVDEQLKFYRNQILPEVTLQVNYGATGLGGTQFIRGEGFPGPVLGEATHPIGDVIGDVFRAAYPTWTAGLVFSYPLGRSSAEAGYARSRLQQNQGRLQIKTLELQIATEIREAGRQVNTSAERIQATRAARVLSERRLDAEQKKSDVGLSTSFLVFQAQRDFATARVNELRAILDYNKSLVDFEAIQEAALTGERIVISGGGQFAATAAGSTVTTAIIQGQR